MLSLLTEFSLKNRIVVLGIFFIILVIAGVKVSQIPVSAFPDTTPVQVQINTMAPALSPQEVEMQITMQVELAISGLPGLVDVRSVSKFGFSQVVVTFRDGVSITDARQFVSERLASVSLPSEIEAPQLGPISTGLGEVFHYILYSRNQKTSLEELRTLHDWVIKPHLRKIPGVAEVNSWGGEVKQYQLRVSPEKLLQYRIGMDEIRLAISKNNLNVGGGLFGNNAMEQMVQGIGRLQSVTEISEIVVRVQNGVPLKIKDLCDRVMIGHEIRRGAVSFQGKGEVVLGLAFSLMGENAKVVTENLRQKLQEILPGLPEDVGVEIVYDRTELTSEVIKTVKHNLFAGAILVSLVLFFLMGSFRAGLLVSLVIPVAMLMSVFGMQWLSISASLLSLGAMDFGIIVDGAVVMCVQNLSALSNCNPSDRQMRFALILASSKQMVRPILFGMGIIVMVFLPVLSLEGVEGKMFHPMAWTFLIALVCALLISLTLTPVLNTFFLPVKPVSSNFLFLFLEKVYQGILLFLFRFPRTLITVCITVAGICGFYAFSLGGEFIPRLSEGSIVISTVRLAGVSIEESVRHNTLIEKKILEEFPDEVRFVWSRIGTAEVATDPMGTELSDIFMTLHPVKLWKKAKTQKELSEKISQVLSGFSGIRMAFTQPIEMRLNEMSFGIRSDVGLKIIGDDFETLVSLGEKAQNLLASVKGASDISTDQITGQPALRIELDHEALSRYGINPAHVLEMVEALATIPAGEIYEDQRRFDLVITLEDRYRQSLEEFESIYIVDGNQGIVPLKNLIKVTETQGFSTINREWGKRLLKVQVGVGNRDVLGYVTEAKERIEKNLKLPPGYFIEWGGQFENLERARKKLMLVIPMSLFSIFCLLYLSMKRFFDVFCIYFSIPFAAVGGVFALYFLNIPFSVSAAIGFIALFGIAVLNGQILVHAIHEFRKEDQDWEMCVIHAALSRLRPVLATAITDACGFIPMALSTGVGAEVQKPLAVVVIGGITTSTLLTLVLIPVLYAWMGKKMA